jgi:hypothetical protein
MHRSRSAATAPKKVDAVSIPAGLKLLKLAAPQHDGLEPQKPKFFPKDVPGHALQINYKYSDTQEVSRWQWLDSSIPYNGSVIFIAGRFAALLVR